jgi:hypothetical protein
MRCICWLFAQVFTLLSGSELSAQCEFSSICEQTATDNCFIAISSFVYRLTMKDCKGVRSFEVQEVRL